MAAADVVAAMFQPSDFSFGFVIVTLFLGFAAGYWVALWHHQYFWWDRVAEWVQIWLHSYSGSVPFSFQSASMPFSAALGMAAVHRLRALGMLA